MTGPGCPYWLLHILRISLSVEPLCQGFTYSCMLFPLSFGMLLARDSIVGISIPSSISLPASIFTRFVIQDPATYIKSHCLQGLCVMLYCRVGPEIPLRHTEWQIPVSIHTNSTNTFEDTCRASLYSPSNVATFDTHKVLLRCLGVAWSHGHRNKYIELQKTVAIN